MREEKTSSEDVIAPKQYAAAIASALWLFAKAIKQNQIFWNLW